MMSGVYLSPLHRRGLPERLFVFDSETFREQVSEKAVRQRAFLTVVYYYTSANPGEYILSERRAFWKSSQFCRYFDSLLQPDSTLYAFAHNLKFDLAATGLLDWILSKYKPSRAPLSSLARFMWNVRSKSGEFWLIDTLNYFATSLASIGKTYGLEKLEMPSEGAERTDWLAYCTRDVEITAQALLALLKLVHLDDWGKFQPTLPGMSYGLFRHKHLQPSTVLLHHNRQLADKERRSYYGGRAECWRIGKVNETLWQLDINSMYPAMMKKHEFPVQYVRSVYSVSPSRLKKWCDRYMVLARVQVDLRKPVLPYRTAKGILYPVGQFETWVCSPELELALQSDSILSVSEAHVYETEKLFRSFVDYAWSKRLQARHDGDEFGAWLWKRVLNSLYGKFGQKQYRTREYKLKTEIDGYYFETAYNATRDVDIEVFATGKRMTVTETSLYNPDASLAIAASVTSYARAFLWRLIERAGLRHVYYMDTDCLIVDKTGFSRLEGLIGDGLGQLKIERQSDDWTFYRPKEYRAGSTRKHRGINFDASWLDEMTATVWQSYGISRMLKEGQTGAVTFRRVVKHLSGEYAGRQVMATGRTVPLQMPNAAIE